MSASHEWHTTYRVARDFRIAERTFARGQILRDDDPDLNLLRRVEMVLSRPLLFIRTRSGERQSLSAGARETVAWRARD
jgi:hypothetical protein